MSQKFTAMYQYDNNKFSIIHGKNQTPEIGDFAQVFHRTPLIIPNHNDKNYLKIIEVVETRNHKTDAKSNISIVMLQGQTL